MSAPAMANRPLVRCSELSAAQQALVRLCQSIDFGYLLDLHVQNGEPVFDPPPRIVSDIKLGPGGNGRPEASLNDFLISEEVRDLLARMEDANIGVIQKVEIRAGIPRRVLIETVLDTSGPRQS